MMSRVVRTAVARGSNRVVFNALGRRSNFSHLPSLVKAPVRYHSHTPQGGDEGDACCAHDHNQDGVAHAPPPPIIRKPFVVPDPVVTPEEMDSTYKRLIEGNRLWVQSTKFQDPDYFARQIAGQHPHTMWIGCSDSRVPANTVTGLPPGEIFVHRNIANTVVHTDLNLLSVLQYAVDVLKVKHIIVCGHVGCGGVRHAMELEEKNFGLVENWLRHIQDTYELHWRELSQIKDVDARALRLGELHVLEGVNNVCKTSIIQRAWRKRPGMSWPHVHGWIYGVHDGVVRELVTVKGPQEMLSPVPK